MSPQIAETLLTLPLFQGLTHRELDSFFSETSPDFRFAKRGQVLANQYSPSTGLIFLIEGSIACVTSNANHAFKLLEFSNSPIVLQPESLFGLHTHYTHTFIAKSKCCILFLRKDFIVNKLINNEVFRFNLLNLMCSRLQLSENSLWRDEEPALANRFIQFVQQRSYFAAGHKRLEIKMNDLAMQIKVTRLNTSKMLHNLSSQNLLILGRQFIEMPMFELLIAQKQKSKD